MPVIADVGLKPNDTVWQYHLRCEAIVEHLEGWVRGIDLAICWDTVSATNGMSLIPSEPTSWLHTAIG